MDAGLGGLARRVRGLAGLFFVVATTALTGCGADGPGENAGESASTSTAEGAEMQASEEARAAIVALEERFGRLGVTSASAVRRRAGAIQVELPKDARTPPPRVSLAEYGSPGWTLTDDKTSMALMVRLEGASNARAELGDGLIAYRKAGPGGGAVIVRPTRFGVEDFVEVTDGSIRELAYRLDLENVAGLRLVEGTLELLDATGDPRLRVRAPEVIDARRTAHPARLELDGCATDTSPADPWTRPVTPPGAKSCRVRVGWDAQAVQYPLLVDPGWSGPFNMSVPRVGHSAARYGSGTTSRVLVCGGRSNASTYLASAEIFNPATNTWATTSSMPAAKAFFTLNVFGTNSDPHAVGGQTSSVPAYTGSVYRFNVSNGTWTTRLSMPTPRAFHAAIATSMWFPTQTLYVTGGTSDTTSPFAALKVHEMYDAEGNTWKTLAPMSAARMTHAVFSGGSGMTRVPQVAGGASSCTATTCTAINSSERYDIANDAWSSGGTLPAAISHATFVHAAKLLVGDGSAAALWTGASSWAAVDTLPQSLTWPAAAAVGGSALAGGGPQDAFKFDGTNWLDAGAPTSGMIGYPTFSQATATTLEDDSVLFTGGLDNSNGPIWNCYRFSQLPQGTPCSKPGACVTNRCVDGYCCNSDCTGACQACSAAVKGQGSNGVCGFIVAGSDPDSNCSDDGAASCSKNGLCDGAGACQLYAQGTQCQLPNCSAGQLTSYACNGSGTCLSSTVSCNGYSCASGTACNTTCSTGAQCLSTHYCAAGGTCEPKLVDGQACTSGGQCINTFCVDSVCCDAACSGICQGCSAAKKGPGGGPDGSCGPIAAGIDPDSECSDQGSTSCGTDGQCNGTGACRLYAAGVACGSTVCVGNSTTGQICNGTGLCINDSTGTNCTPYLCTGGACANPCISDASCVPGNYCSSGTCSPKLANGQTCTGANQCTNGFCVDGFCCNQACGGLCQACSAAKKGGGQNGECGPVLTGLDPDADCNASGQCGTDGTCDGSGGCKLRASGSPCGSPVCVGNLLTSQECNGLGACVNATGGADCAPFVCQSGACSTPCATDAHCVSGYFCDSGTCVAKLAKGTPCTAANQCSSGSCVDGVCCDSGCSGLCQACSAAKKGLGNNGDCGPIAAGADPDDECAVGGQCGTSGNCDGSGACQLVPAGTACGATQCVGNKSTGQLCNGSGACVNDTIGTDCSPSLCIGGACAKPCGADSQCINGYYCDGAGTCQQKKTQGGTCSASNQCTTSFCADGVCCSAACTSPCMACAAALKETGVDGECGPAKNGLDPHNDCPDDGALTCQRDGVCDGTSKCRLYQQGVACGATACVGNTVKGKICSGIGACVTDANGVDCAPYLCLSGGCATSCQLDSECLGEAFCKAGLCTQKGDPGVTCSKASECKSGFCVDEVCCDASCNGQCEACDAPSSPGTCTTITGAPHGGRPACAGTGDCVGNCDGTDPTTCKLPDGATVCAPASCTGDVSQPAGGCDGAGSCKLPPTAPCLPYACDASTGACETSCTSNAECSQGAKCDTLSGKCAVTSATCKDAFTVAMPNGQELSCAPYKCAAGACADSCSADADCAPGYDCKAPTCVAAADAGTDASTDAGTDAGTEGGAGSGGSDGATDDSDGCGCRTIGQSDRRGSAALLGALLAALALHRRRRR